MTDMTSREWLIFAPLLSLVIWMGIYPTTFSNFYQVNLQNILVANVTHHGVKR